MTNERMIELLSIEHECMRRGAHNECDRDCAKCELVQDDVELDEMYTGVIALLKEHEAMNVDAFLQWCIDSHIMGDATVRGIKYWVGKYKETEEGR